jgi:gas vesicle protein
LKLKELDWVEVDQWKGGIQMETTGRKYYRFMTGLLIGSAMGGLAGLLFAPKSGRELRADIRTAGEKTFKETKDFIGKANRRASETRQKARNIWSCIRERGEAAPRYGAESAEEFAGEA